MSNLEKNSSFLSVDEFLQPRTSSTVSSAAPSPVCGAMQHMWDVCRTYTLGLQEQKKWLQTKMMVI